MLPPVWRFSPGSRTQRSWSGSSGLPGAPVLETEEDAVKLFAENPDPDGFFGPFGGIYMPEILMPAVKELGRAFEEARADETFNLELAKVMREFSGRPTPLT